MLQFCLKLGVGELLLFGVVEVLLFGVVELLLFGGAVRCCCCIGAQIKSFLRSFANLATQQQLTPQNCTPREAGASLTTAQCERYWRT